MYCHLEKCANGEFFKKKFNDLKLLQGKKHQQLSYFLVLYIVDLEFLQTQTLLSRLLGHVFIFVFVGIHGCL